MWTQAKHTLLNMDPSQVHSPQCREWGNGSPIPHLPKGIHIYWHRLVFALSLWPNASQSGP